MAALYFGALRTVAALFIASLLWGAAAAAGGAFCVLEKAPYCWGNWKTLASSSSTLLSGLTTKAAGEYGGKVAFGDVDGDGIDEVVLVSDSSMIVYAHDASTTASPTPRPTTPRPTTSRPTACLPSTLYLTFSGRSYLNGDYDYVAAGSDFTDASEYDICDDSYHLWSKASGTGVLCWSASYSFYNHRPSQK